MSCGLVFPGAVVAEHDPWKIYTNLENDPRVVFLISDCSSTSPLPKVRQIDKSIALTF